ncbi:hypothetical protein BD410DRAFT_833413 [Rickenella mellea]|uniref:Uncharacterized protein n=1 Tax=Rickenella mellea TaxID=50990 RepID=A0A4V3AZG5_9AGAM|nr:hypothetical protein BD410DRAFT_833413 [Rickenella mellea]
MSAPHLPARPITYSLPSQPDAAAVTSQNSPSATSTKPAPRPIKIRDFAHPTSDPRHYGEGFDPYDGGHRIVNEFHAMLENRIEKEKLDRNIGDETESKDGERRDIEEEEKILSPEEFVQLALRQEIRNRSIMRKRLMKKFFAPQRNDIKALVQMSRDSQKARIEKARLMAEAGVKAKKDNTQQSVGPHGVLPSTVLSLEAPKAKPAGRRPAMADSVKDDGVSGHAPKVNGNGKKRSVDEIVDEGDQARESYGSKRARTSGEGRVGAQSWNEGKREGKKRARFDDDNDEVSPILSGDARQTSDDQHQAKRTKRSPEGPSISHGSASPRGLGTTVDNGMPATTASSSFDYDDSYSDNDNYSSNTSASSILDNSPPPVSRGLRTFCKAHILADVPPSKYTPRREDEADMRMAQIESGF